jgi:hypothetical protein
MANDICECGHGFLSHERIGHGHRCLSCRCVTEGPIDAPTSRYKPPGTPPAATPARSGTAELVMLAQRGVRALESIAASLEKLANPPVVARPVERPPPPRVPGEGVRR